MDKWVYIKLIGELSDKHGDKLLDMLNQYNKYGLRDLTYQETKEYWEKINKEIIRKSDSF